MQIKSVAVCQMLSCMLLYLGCIPCPHCCFPWRETRGFQVWQDHHSVGSFLSNLIVPSATSQGVCGHVIASCAALTLCVLRPGGGGAARLLRDHHRARLRDRVRGRPLHQVLEAQARAHGR